MRERVGSIPTVVASLSTSGIEKRMGHEEKAEGGSETKDTRENRRR